MTPKTEAIEVEMKEDGSMVSIGSREWQTALLDARSIRLLGAVADDDSTWDVYTVVHRDGIERTYAVPS